MPQIGKLLAYDPAKHNDVSWLLYRFGPNASGATINSVTIAENCRHQGVGIGLIRTVAQESMLRGISTLKIATILKDGFTLWPYLGAIPEEGFKRLPQAIDKVKQKHPDEIPATCKALIERHQQRGVDHFEIWRQLTMKESEGGLPQTLATTFTRATIFDSDLFMDLNDPYVQKRLRLTLEHE